jgi:sugar lactone lactonase YvrE
MYYQESNLLFICDAGYFGSTNLNKPSGSVYYVDLENKITKPLLVNCLSYPSDICIDSESGRIYITETFKNRILRVVQSPFGTFHTSVFHQFNGRLGPTAICLATTHEDLSNYIFVARYEYQNNDNTIDGLICVLNKEGTLIGELILPTLS